MDRKIVFSLLIQCIILFQEATSLSETNSASLDRHVRKKRVIDVCSNRDQSFLNQDIRYVVPIIKDPRGLESGAIHCTGSILAPRIIITAGQCVANEKCYVLTGGHRERQPIVHHILHKHVYEGFNINVKKKDLALLVLAKPIDLIHSYLRAIKLYNGRTLPANTYGIFSGWGSTTRTYVSTPSQPQSIKVRILNFQQCQDAYSDSPLINITSDVLCTYYNNREKCCWLGDSGGPLVVNGRLVGILSWCDVTGGIRYPDVFTNLLHSDYKNWVEHWLNHFLIRYPH